MADVICEVCMKADGGDLPYYAEVRDRETGDVLFCGAKAGSSQMARHLALCKLQEWIGVVMDNVPILTTREAMECKN